MDEVTLTTWAIQKLISGDTILGAVCILLFFGSKKLVLSLMDIIKRNTEVIAQNNELIRLLMGKGES